MKTIFIFFISTYFHILIIAQKPFYLSLEQPELDYISDVAKIGDKFYFIQNKLINLDQPYYEHDSYSDLIITNSEGSVLETHNLNGFQTNYHRILKVVEDTMFLVGVLESDTCKSIIVFSKFNLQSKALKHIALHEFCNHSIIMNIKIVLGLNGQVFIDEYHFNDNNPKKSIHKLDSAYNLSLVFDSIALIETISIDFSRKGYVKATVGVYDFYDANFNFRKQRYTNEAFTAPQETHKPFGKHLILEQGAQNKYSKPDYGLQVRLIDSNLIIKKNAIILPFDFEGTRIEMPFYGGIDIQNENEIWVAGTFGYFDWPPDLPSYYYISKLDSNLNVVCQHFLGYDTRYMLFGIRAFENDGAIVFGRRLKEGLPVNEGEDIFALRVGENCELPSVSTTDPNHPLLSISAYPNPTINSLTFDVNGFDPSTLAVEFFNEQGAIIFSKKDLSYEIKVADMPPGQYFYRILEGDKLLGVGAWVKQ